MLNLASFNQLPAGLKLDEFPEPGITRLRYPVLLCHGYGALINLVKPAPLYDVAMLMRTHNVLAFAPNIAPYATIEKRAARWVKIIRELTKRLEVDKLNVVGHSMGGLDMRYALSQLEIASRVASLTTVSTPHRGSSLAEWALQTPAGIRSGTGYLLDRLADYLYPDAKNEAIASARQLTRSYITDTFNPATPDISKIPYYSFSSAVGKGTDQSVKIISRYQNSHIYKQEGLNDGMVSVASARWGEHIKTGAISHLEQMNLRVKHKREPLFEAFWLAVLNMLQAKGY